MRHQIPLFLFVFKVALICTVSPFRIFKGLRSKCDKNVRGFFHVQLLGNIALQIIQLNPASCLEGSECKSWPEGRVP